MKSEKEINERIAAWKAFDKENHKDSQIALRELRWVLK
jgi:hypothetical protein